MDWGRDREFACVCEAVDRAENVDRRFFELEDARCTLCALRGGEVTRGGSATWVEFEEGDVGGGSAVGEGD